jgi:sugar/nucleoside kinase (ribokinase family)
VEIAEFSQQGGGAAATAAATLAVLGAPSRFVGKVADDHFGQFLCRGLEQLEVDVRFLLVERGKVSPFSYIAVEAGSGRRQIHRSRGNVSKLQPTEIDVNAVLDEANLLVIDGQMPAVQLELADAASKRGIPVIWDAHTTLAETERMLAYTTVLLASERFAMEVAQVADLEQGLRQITELGPETCVITLGDEGAVGVSKRRSPSTSSIPPT